ncbi:MAG: dephospho-CoA kinase [Sphingomicrobium sp.]
MIRIALTGSIGMGKSTVARMFEAAGVPLFDADVEVRRLQEPGGVLVKPTAALFPAAVRNGAIDRDALGRAVLGDPAALARLEALVHPAVRAARERFIAGHRAAPALLFDIPLLFETAGEHEFDKVIVVSATAEIQRARVLARPGMTTAKFEAIMARQMTDADKVARADFVIDTNGDLSTTQAQVRDIIACLGLARHG